MARLNNYDVLEGEDGAVVIKGGKGRREGTVKGMRGERDEVPPK